MTTVRKSILEFQPSEEVLQQIVTSAQSGNHNTVRALLKQSMRPRSKKEALQSSAQDNWNERLVLLQLYVTTKSAEGDAERSGEEEDEAPVDIPSDWKTATTPSAKMYRLLYAYRYYRQQNYSKVVHLYLQQKEIPNETSVQIPLVDKKIHLAWEHLYAQSLHHVQNGKTALQVYQDVLSLLKHPSSLSLRPDQVLQLYTNYVAIVLSYFTIPYCLTSNAASHQNNNEEIMTQIRQSVMLQLTKQGREEDTSSSQAMMASLYFDLSYNVATYYLLSTASTAQERQEWLQVLFSYSNNIEDNNDDDKCRFKNQFSLRLNHKLFREYFWNMSSSMMKRTNLVSYGDTNELLFSNIDETDGLAKLSVQQQCVYRMNDTMLSLQQSVSSFGMTQSSSPERILQSLISEYNAATGDNNQKYLALTNLQLHIVHYNIAVYQYYCKQYTSCQQTCQHYFLSTSNNSKSSKKKKKTTATNGTLNAVDIYTFEVSSLAQYQTPDEKLFWESRAMVLHAYCAVAMVSSPTTTSGMIADDTTNRSDIVAPLNDDIIKVLSSAVEMLDPFCVIPSTNDHSIEVCNHVVLYTRLHQYALRAKLSIENDSSLDISLQMLESLPEPIRSKPTLQSIIRQQQKRAVEQSKHDSNLQYTPIDDKPTLSKLVDMVQSIETSKTTQSSEGKDWQRYVLYADFAVSQKRYADAIAMYEAVINAGKVGGSSDNTTMMANYVCALSHVRPTDAIAVWSGMSSSIVAVPDLISSDNMTSASELEMKEITFHSSMNTVQSTALANENNVSDDAINKKKKSHDAVLRQRAKKREVYMQQHQKAKGTTGTILSQQPDPERWLPKHERSSYAKYRRNYKKGAGGIQPASQSKSSQGIVSAQDMAKLDVVAHQAAAAAMAAEGTTDGSTIAALRSTAHMNVSNKGRGKKRR